MIRRARLGDEPRPLPAWRRGYARFVVALHLQDMAEKGVETAILFASGKAACRAYVAIGFERIGIYSLAILSGPITVR